MQAAGAVRLRRRRDLHGHARRGAARSRPRGRDRLGAVQVVPGRPRAHAGVHLAPARPDGGRREADRHGRGDEVPLLRRAASGEARLARAPVPAGVRARPHRARPVRRVAGGAGAATARCRSSTASRSARRRACSPPRRTWPGGSSARPASSPRCCPIRRRSSTTGTTGRATSSSPSTGSTAPSASTCWSRRPRASRRSRSWSPATGPTASASRSSRASRGRRRARALRRACRRGGARRPLRDVLRHVLRPRRRGLRAGAVRVVPVRQAGDHHDRRRRPARGRARRLHRAASWSPAPAAVARRRDWLRDHPDDAAAFGRAGNAIAAQVTWDRAIGRLLS